MLLNVKQEDQELKCIDLVLPPWRKFNKVPFSMIYRYMQSLKREREKKGEDSVCSNQYTISLNYNSKLPFFYKKAQNYLSTFVSTLEKWLDFYLEKGKFPTSATAHSQFLHQSQLRSWSQIISKSVHQLKKVIKSIFSYCFSPSIVAEGFQSNDL